MNDEYDHLPNDGLKFLQWIAYRSLTDEDFRQELLSAENAKPILEREMQNPDAVGKLEGLDKVTRIRYVENTEQEITLALPAKVEIELDIGSSDITMIQRFWPH